MYTKWMFHTADRPGIRLASPGTVPKEISHSFATGTILPDIEGALCARGRVLAATRGDPDISAARSKLGTLNNRGGDFIIFVIYAGIVVKICLLAP